nr:tRNA (adenosine(37)-N6)-threonylcarbamoyltransferase complex ATPase subunit type 1 TsaE [Pseudoclavibacter sp. Marseille-Q3772]
MCEVRVTVPTTTAMDALGRRLASLCRAGDVLSLTGPLGAGKTTLVRGFGAALGVRGAVSSPTFVIARTHPPLRGGAALIHVDAYRLGSALELDDLDLDLDASVTVIEWGSEVVSAITDTWLDVTIVRSTGGAGSGVGVGDGAGDPADDEGDDDPREVLIRGVGRRWQEVDLSVLAEPLSE